MVGALTKNNNYMITILEGKVNGTVSRGKYLDHIAKEVG